ILDMLGRPGQRFTVTDTFYEGMEYRLVDLLYEQTAPVREHPLGSAPALAPNPIPRPDTAIAERHHIVPAAGMMGGMRGAMVGGQQLDMRSMMQNGLAWAMNGVAATGHVLDPLLTLARGSSCILTLKNETAWHHPMHLHGHVFRVLSRDGNPVARE